MIQELKRLPLGKTKCRSKRRPIYDYVGTILNKFKYYRRIRRGEKRFEIKFSKVPGLPPAIIFHPGRDL